MRQRFAAAACASLLLASCAMQPMGPTVAVMPAPNKPFPLFAQEQEACKAYASSQVKGQADAANQRALGATLLGAGLGAGLGAAVGGGHGAGIGAASGGILGTAVGADQSNGAQQGIQQQYDTAYATCMYAKGNQVPGMASPIAEVGPDPVPLTPTAAHSVPLSARALGSGPSRWAFHGGGYSQEAKISPLGGGRYKMDLLTGGHDCAGWANGMATDQGHGRFAFTAADDYGDSCRLDIRLIGHDRMSVEEVDCGAFHGKSCEFEGTLTRTR